MPTFTDAFTRADAASLGANWTADGLLGVLSNAVAAQAAPYFSTEGYTGTWAADHYSQVKLLAIPTFMAGAVVRRQGYDTFYAGGLDPNDVGDNRCVIWRYNTEVYTAIADAPGQLIAVNDIIYLEIVGSLLTLKINGVQKIQVTDTSISTAGRPGMKIYHNSTATAILDDWEGGDFAAAGGSILRQMVQHGLYASTGGRLG